MKKIIAVILLICTLLSLVACDSDSKNPSTTVDDSNKDDSNITVSANIKAWAFHSFEKTVVNIKPQGNGFSTDYTVYLSKGETEGCQVAAYSDTKLTNVTFVQTSSDVENIETSIYEMSRTHDIKRKYYTDALVPYNGGKLTLEKKRILPFMIEFKTNENTVAGDYKYTYELRDQKGKPLASYEITVHVWDFTLPADKTFVTALGLTNEGIFYHGGLYEGWYNVLLEHNICAYTLPYDILDERADAYMSDPRVTSFMINVTNYILEEAKLLKIYEKLKTNPVWLEKAYFYPLDEPRTKQHLYELRNHEKRLSELCPEIEIMAPYYTNIPLGEGRDQTDDMAEYTDLWCPKLCLWDDERSYGDFLDYTPSKSFAERMAEQQAKGDRMWTYVCNDPDDPYAQLFIDTEGVHQRLMFWQIYQRDIEGFLYWSTNYYGRNGGVRINPWEDTNTRVENGDGQTIYGCGFLFYPGKYVDVKDCVPSIRAKIIRDGVDDIEMFYLAEKYLDKEWLIEKTKEGTPTLTEYANGDKFASLRIEIGNALEAAMKNK